MKLKDILLEALNEMPHIELGSGKVIDLCIEKYPIPSDQRLRLQQAFRMGGGVIAQTAKGLIVFNDNGMHPASPSEEAKLPRLPIDWQRYAIQVQ